MRVAGYRPSQVTIHLGGTPWALTMPQEELTQSKSDLSKRESFPECPEDHFKDYGTFLLALKNPKAFQDLVREFRKSLDIFGPGASGFRFKVNGEHTVPCNVPESEGMDYAKAEYYNAYLGLKDGGGGAEPILMHAEMARSLQDSEVPAMLAHHREFFKWAENFGLPNVALSQSQHYIQYLQFHDPYNHRRETAYMNSAQVVDRIELLFNSVRGNSNPPLELPQFGLIYGKTTDENGHPIGILNYHDTGPRTASWQFQTMFRLKARETASVKFYHWDTTFDRMPLGGAFGESRYLALSGLGWLYQVLDNPELQGAETFVLETSPSQSADTEAYAVGFKKGAKLFIISSTFSADSDGGVAQNLAVKIPQRLLPAGALSVRMTELHTWNAPHSKLRRMVEQGKFDVPGRKIVLDPLYVNKVRLLGRAAEMFKYATPQDASVPKIWETISRSLSKAGENKTEFESHVRSLLQLKETDSSALVRTDAGANLMMGRFFQDHVKVFEITGSN
jgi:hypothetical protein